MVDVGGIPMVMTGGGYGYGDGCGMGGGIWAILLLALLGGRGFGYGHDGHDGYGYGGPCCPPATCQDVNQAAQYTELNGRFNDINERIDDVNQQGLLRDIWEKECCIDKNIVQQAYNLDKSILTGNYALKSSIDQNRFDTAIGFKNAELLQQECCCKELRADDQIRFEAQQNKCEIMKNDDCNTQKILDKLACNEIQELRDKLQAERFQNSQLVQNTFLVNQLRPYPTPSYPSCNPMTVCAPYGGYPYGVPFGGFKNDACGCCAV